MVQTYRGYGSSQHIFLMGRVFREPFGPELGSQDLWGQIKAIGRLMRRWGIGDARLQARFGDIETTIRTDNDGYFRLDVDLPTPPAVDEPWQQVAIHLAEPTTIDTIGDVFIARDDCRFVVISDIDDTVMHTGVANKLMMMWRLFVQGADSREAFPGMATFLRALHRGRSQQGMNPMLYVSRAPWAIYGVLERFFNVHEIPVGPIMFLREWGLTLQHPFPRRGKGHKHALIRQMIVHYGNLPFILIGDSGQRDPEIYADIVQSFPNRVLAVYIRDVSSDPGRQLAIRRMEAEFAGGGSLLVLASDTAAMAQHAADQGLIAETTLADIDAESVPVP